MSGCGQTTNSSLSLSFFGWSISWGSSGNQNAGAETAKAPDHPKELSRRDYRQGFRAGFQTAIDTLRNQTKPSGATESYPQLPASGQQQATPAQTTTTSAATTATTTSAATQTTTPPTTLETLDAEVNNAKTKDQLNRVKAKLMGLCQKVQNIMSNAFKSMCNEIGGTCGDAFNKLKFAFSLLEKLKDIGEKIKTKEAQLDRAANPTGTSDTEMTFLEGLNGGTPTTATPATTTPAPSTSSTATNSNNTNSTTSTPLLDGGIPTIDIDGNGTPEYYLVPADRIKYSQYIKQS